MLGSWPPPPRGGDARRIYEARDVVWNARFVDVLSNAGDGRLLIDLSKLHDIEPL